MYDSLINVNGSQVPTLDILLLLTIISLLPSLLIMMTSFTRTIIILSFLRNALGIQQTPPNMVLVGISIFLTLFIMDPIIGEVNTEAYQPYQNQEISTEEFFDRAQVPIKRFMLKNTEKSSLALFTDMAEADIEEVEELTDLSITVMYEVFVMAVQLAGPLLVISMLVGILIAIFQAATQIHEQTITFVPKLLVIGIILVFTGGSMLQSLQDFTVRIFQMIEG